MDSVIIESHLYCLHINIKKNSFLRRNKYLRRIRSSKKAFALVKYARKWKGDKENRLLFELQNFKNVFRRILKESNSYLFGKDEYGSSLIP